MPSVVIYSTPTCPYCRDAKMYLSKKGIFFNEYDVATDQVRADEMITKSGQRGVPVIDIDGEIIIGFDKEKIDQALVT